MTSITQAADPAEPYVASSAPARIAPRVIDGMCRIPRLDLRHGRALVCSVDPPGCVDIDDALHAKPLEGGLFEVRDLPRSRRAPLRRSRCARPDLAWSRRAGLRQADRRLQ